MTSQTMCRAPESSTNSPGDLNLLDKIDGIASVSGGTWLSCIYVFAKTFKVPLKKSHGVIREM